MPSPLSCRICGQPLTDKTSRLYKIGPRCRDDMTGEELAAAMRLTRDEANPGYIPPARRATFEARINNAKARYIAAQAAAPDVCRHDGIVGRCPECRREEDLGYCVQKIIKQVQRERDEAKQAARAGSHA